MYSEKVMDHFENPRNMGEIEDASGVGTVGNAKCGDIMRIFMDIDEEGIIHDVKFKTFGCGAAVATSSMATELVKGKHIQEALKVTNQAVMEALDGLPPVKVHCSLLAEEAIHAALWDYAQKKGIVIEGLEPPKSDVHETVEEEDPIEEEHSIEEEHPIKEEHSIEEGHSIEEERSKEEGPSKEEGFSKEEGPSMGKEPSKEKGHSKEEERSIEGGRSRGRGTFRRKRGRLRNRKEQ
jgi:nitrogen fixation NifU-like protein